MEIKSLDGKITEQILADDISHRSLCRVWAKNRVSIPGKVGRSFYDSWAAASDARPWPRREAVAGLPGWRADKKLDPFRVFHEECKFESPP